MLNNFAFKMYVKNKNACQNPSCKLQSEKKPDNDGGQVAISTRKSHAQQCGSEHQPNSITIQDITP